MVEIVYIDNWWMVEIVYIDNWLVTKTVYIGKLQITRMIYIDNWLIATFKNWHYVNITWSFNFIDWNKIAHM
jgi:hypothetical protein